MPSASLQISRALAFFSSFHPANMHLALMSMGHAALKVCRYRCFSDMTRNLRQEPGLEVLVSREIAQARCLRCPVVKVTRSRRLPLNDLCGRSTRKGASSLKRPQVLLSSPSVNFPSRQKSQKPRATSAMSSCGYDA